MRNRNTNNEDTKIPRVDIKESQYVQPLSCNGPREDISRRIKNAGGKA